MKERFIFGSSDRSRGRRALLVVTFAVVVILALDVFSQGMVRSFVRGLASHVWVSGNAGVASVEQAGLLSTRAMLARENASLKAQVVQYQDKAASNEVLTYENAELRTLVNLAARERGISSAVVSSLHASPYGTFLISAHAPEVAAGDLVLSPDGFVIGRVVDASRSNALVSEIFASDATLEGLVAGNVVSLKGYGGGNARTSVPRNLAIAVGDIVIAPSLGQRPIAVIGAVQSSAASADQTVFVRSPANLSSLRFVHVVPAQ